MYGYKLFKQVIAIIFILMTIQPLTAYAATGDRYQFKEGGNWFAAGGYNKYDYIEAKTRDEANELELKVRAENYILVNSDNMQISYEDYKAIRDYKGYWFTKYMEHSDPIWNEVKVYMYKPSFDEYIELVKSKSRDTMLCEEINESTVVIDYRFFYYQEQVGTITDEYNDNIPDYIKTTGYMEIRSPVDCEIKVMRASTRTYHIFYVKKETPFLVRLVCDCYHIVNVNGKELNDNIEVIGSGEDTLPFNNQIQILITNTEDNPYVIELNDLTVKYKIKDANLNGKPDYSLLSENKTYEYDIDIAEENTILYDISTDKEKENNSISQYWWVWIILGIVGVIGVVYLIVIVKNNNYSNDDDDISDE